MAGWLNKLFTYCFLAAWIFLSADFKVFFLCISKNFVSEPVVAQCLMTGRESRRIMSCSWFFYWMVQQNIHNLPLIIHVGAGNLIGRAFMFLFLFLFLFLFQPPTLNHVALLLPTQVLGLSFRYRTLSY